MGSTVARSETAADQQHGFRHWIGQKATRLGQVLGVRWLVYNPVAFLDFHEHALRHAPGVIRALIDAFPQAKRYVDIGSGSGAFAAQVNRAGRTAQACEHARFGRYLARKQGVDCRPFDLMHDLPAQLDGPFDLAYCFEVAEHLPPMLGDRLVEFTASQAPLVVFTAAPPGQGGLEHINEQPREYWIERFVQRGMSYQPEMSQKLSEAFAREGVAYWFVRNVMVFTRNPAT